MHTYIHTYTYVYEADQGLASAAWQHDEAGARAPMRKHLGERLLLIWPDTRDTHM
jgi:hypothetical protein